jgi:O-antigen/teichoic acid export membrane protein
MIGQAAGLIISFIARIIFIKYLSAEYLGLNGLFTNILTMLSLVELGVGPAMTFSLYKPLAENNTEKVKSLMKLYQKVYCIIGVAVLILGIGFTPFYKFLIDEVPNIPNLNLIYILFVVNTSVSYFYSYKRSLIICDQKRYIATIYRYSFYFVLNVAQIIALVCTKNYILYLILQIIFTWLENFFVSRKANKMYPYLKDKEYKPLEKEEKDNIKKNVGAMVCHKIGGMVVNSTDNIIMSRTVGLLAVGIYSNYYLVINALETIIMQVFNAIVASVGNLNATEDKSKIKNIFDKIFFINFWIFSFCSICLLVLFNDFIYLWVGKDYLFSFSIVIILCICFYLKGMRRTVLTFRDATGSFYYDRHKPLVEAVINLVVSILLAKKYGVAGIFIGTIISTVTTSLWVEPYVLYKHIFNMNVKDYFKRLTKYTLIGLVVCLITYYACHFISSIGWIYLILKLIICVFIVNILFIIIFKDTEEFEYCKYLLKTIAKKIKNTKENYQI